MLEIRKTPRYGIGEEKITLAEAQAKGIVVHRAQPHLVLKGKLLEDFTEGIEFIEKKPKKPKMEDPIDEILNLRHKHKINHDDKISVEESKAKKIQIYKA